MGLREVTGYIAHVLLAAYWIWVVSSTAAQLRSTSRSPRLRLQVALVKTAAVAVTAVVVGVIHFWATHWWHVVVTLVVAAPIGIGLRHVYRHLVVAPRHRRTLVQRAHVYERIHVGERPGDGLPPAGGPVPPRLPRASRAPATTPRHRTTPLPRPSPDRPATGVHHWWTSRNVPAPRADPPTPAPRGSTSPW